MTTAAFLELAVRCMLVVLFLPFSALDKIFNFRGAVQQAGEETSRKPLAAFLVLCGLAIEIFMSLAIITGFADRLAALVLALYCIATACLWKQFWNPREAADQREARDLFWDFFKNFSLAGGFLLLAFGTNASSVRNFVAHPLSSSHPYRIEDTRS
jgi:putative oxidoreductase